MSYNLLNSLPNDKILDVSKLKASADDNLNVARMMISLLDHVENTMGKGENAGYQHFLLFQQFFFLKPSSVGWLKVGIVWQGLNLFPNKPLFLTGEVI